MRSGWIHTLLEEAENERMHLLTFLNAFKPGRFTRFTVFVTQFGFFFPFTFLYIASPRTAHRLVGYIEEMAVITYTNIVEVRPSPSSWPRAALVKIARPVGWVQNCLTPDCR